MEAPERCVHWVRRGSSSGRGQVWGRERERRAREVQGLQTAIMWSPPVAALQHTPNFWTPKRCSAELCFMCPSTRCSWADISWNTLTTIIKIWLIKSEGLFQCCINLVQAADVRGTASLFTTWQLKKKKDNVLASNSTFFLVLKVSLCYHYKPLWYVFHESFRCQGKTKIYNDH